MDFVSAVVIQVPKMVFSPEPNNNSSVQQEHCRERRVVKKIYCLLITTFLHSQNILIRNEIYFSHFRDLLVTF